MYIEITTFIYHWLDQRWLRSRYFGDQRFGRSFFADELHMGHFTLSFIFAMTASADAAMTPLRVIVRPYLTTHLLNISARMAFLYRLFTYLVLHGDAALSGARPGYRYASNTDAKIPRYHKTGHN